MKINPSSAISHILVAEVDQNRACLIQKKLQTSDCPVEIALTGKEVIAHITQSPDVLLVLDYELPDMNGSSLLAALSEMGCHVPFIVTTCYGDEQMAVEMMRLGARDYLIKDTNFIDRLHTAVIFALHEIEIEYKLHLAEASQQKAEEKILQWANIFEYAEWGIVISGSINPTLDLMNPAFARMHGQSIEELTGQSLEYVVAPPECHRLAEQIRLSVEKGHHTFEIDHIREDGSTFPTQMDITVVKDQSGDVLHWIMNIQDISERKHAEHQIQDSLREKEVLLREIHHRVKNNLQVIISLLGLQAGTIADAETRALFQESQGRIRSMALVHEELYRSKNLAKINLNDYLHRLAIDLFNFYDHSSSVTLRVEVDDIFLSVEETTPCGMIVHELVANALKHAFPKKRAGEIKISMHKVDSSLVLTVSDNGIGFSPGLDFHKAGSLGLQLVNILTSQLEGAIEMQSIPDQGTAFTLTFAQFKI
jgi:PAS domain S-box-containing protein